MSANGAAACMIDEEPQALADEIGLRQKHGEIDPAHRLRLLHFDTLSAPGLLAFIRNASGTTRRVAAACTGAFALAEAGLLDGRRATTHWMFARDLQTRFPKVKVEADRIFITDGTSAGMTAAMDLALAIVEKDLGVEKARSVAQMLVVYHRRAGGQSQHSALLEREAKSGGPL